MHLGISVRTSVNYRYIISESRSLRKRISQLARQPRARPSARNSREANASPPAVPSSSSSSTSLRSQQSASHPPPPASPVSSCGPPRPCMANFAAFFTWNTLDITYVALLDMLALVCVFLYVCSCMEGRRFCVIFLNRLTLRLFIISFRWVCHSLYIRLQRVATDAVVLS